ncbi:MAG: mismatch repair protein MutT [Ferruginibacter sp.]|nr:mismatch repair protein MutT [Ferruginibacter sp.]
MEHSDVKILSSEYLNRHPYFTARKDSYQTATGKIVDPYYVVELGTCVCAMALTENNEVLLVKQYRHPIGRTIIEIPGGFIDNDETPETAIARELAEETGYSFSSFHELGTTAANPGVLNNYTHLFLATGGTKTGDQVLDHNEEIEIMLKPLEEIRQMLQRDEFIQTMHALCLHKAFQFLDNQR